MARLSCKNACQKCLCAAVRLSFFARCHPASAPKAGALKRPGVAGQKGNKSRQATVSYSFFSRRPDFSLSTFWFSAFSKPSIFIFARIYVKTPLNRPKTSYPSALSSNCQPVLNDYRAISSDRQEILSDSQAFWMAVARCERYQAFSRDCRTSVWLPGGFE